LISRTVEVVNKRGLHARASAKFVTLASQIDAQIEVDDEGDGNVALDREFEDPDAAHLDLPLDRLRRGREQAALDPPH